MNAERHIVELKFIIMKKLILGILFLGLIGFGVVGCKKDNVFPNSLQNSKNEFNVSTDG